jgi:radical SAM superfamily enzyme YgiQ (UPF0313 family)
MSAAASTPRERRKVVLVNPNRMKPPVAPIALDYLAHALSASGFETDVLDLCFSEDVGSDIEAYFAHNDVLAVAVSLRNADDTSFATQDFCIDRYKEVVDLIKESTSAPVILGGSGFSIMPQAILDYCDVALGIWGEGEESLPLLLDRIARGDDPGDVPGLVYRARDGFVATRPSYVDLSVMPAPSRSAVDNHRYFVEGAMAGIETKRGCPNDCIYCVDPVGKGGKLRLRSPGSVADEAQSLLDLGIDHIHLCDSEFNIPEGHARDVCQELEARGLGGRLRWYTYATPAGFSRDMARLLRGAGCAGVNFGVDSGSEEVLRRLGRDFTVEQIARTAQACRSEGLVCMFDLLVGGPGETRDTLRETIETMKRVSPDRVGANIGVRVFPGTALARMLIAEGPLDTNPSLRGSLSGNDDFFRPVYYVSSDLGPDPTPYLADLIGGDERFFFFGDTAGADQNYNYNDNTVLVDAIREGYRGAFWDILRRLSEAGKAS